MFCKYCGKPIQGTSCDACGKDIVLRAHSQDLNRWMEAPTSNSKPIPSSGEPAYQKGLAAGYENGKRDGYSMGVSEGISSTNKRWEKRAQTALAIACSICVVLSSISALMGYRSGHQAGYVKGDSDGYTRGSEVGTDEGYDAGLAEGLKLAEERQRVAYNEGYTNGSSDGYAIGYSEGKEYAATVLVTPTSMPAISQVFKLGSSGADVETIQLRLKSLGYYSGEIDGDFGSGTKEAVIEFQINNNLHDDGEVGANTWSMLMSDDAIGKSVSTEIPVPQLTNPSDEPMGTPAYTPEISTMPMVTPIPTDV